MTDRSKKFFKKPIASRTLECGKNRFVYWDKEKSEIPEWANDYFIIKTLPKMTTRQQQAAVKAQEKRQQELVEKDFKQRARFQALTTAQYLKPNTEYIREGKEVRKTTEKFDITKEAEKIYQWLIKV